MTTGRRPSFVTACWTEGEARMDWAIWSVIWTRSTPLSAVLWPWATAEAQPEPLIRRRREREPQMNADKRRLKLVLAVGRFTASAGIALGQDAQVTGGPDGVVEGSLWGAGIGSLFSI